MEYLPSSPVIAIRFSGSVLSAEMMTRARPSGACVTSSVIWPLMIPCGGGGAGSAVPTTWGSPGGAGADGEVV